MTQGIKKEMEKEPKLTGEPPVATGLLYARRGKMEP